MDRAEAIFAFWLEHRVYYTHKFTEYRRLCDEGKVAGFELPGSDTVTGGGGVTSPEQRDEYESVKDPSPKSAPIPRNAGEQRGRHQGVEGGDGRRDCPPI